MPLSNPQIVLMRRAILAAGGSIELADVRSQNVVERLVQRGLLAWTVPHFCRYATLGAGSLMDPTRDAQTNALLRCIAVWRAWRTGARDDDWLRLDHTTHIRPVTAKTLVAHRLVVWNPVTHGVAGVADQIRLIQRTDM